MRAASAAVFPAAIAGRCSSLFMSFELGFMIPACIWPVLWGRLVGIGAAFHMPMEEHVGDVSEPPTELFGIDQVIIVW